MPGATLDNEIHKRPDYTEVLTRYVYMWNWLHEGYLRTGGHISAREPPSRRTEITKEGPNVDATRGGFQSHEGVTNGP
ncbi:hypothetical protein AJ80_04705 [Polytolypa hystricis UAMH7299]|uniref:Uncharacterized protein n=1 Tax=Polytolypa hystricis (strain UAMH7299) TaxID=1447883 RepID=A0A2B7YAR9_POLH7|nr:hypothetical protein AJ80_04705 [Polytolypa hystricis UAMH7299]